MAENNFIHLEVKLTIVDKKELQFAILKQTIPNRGTLRYSASNGYIVRSIGKPSISRISDACDKEIGLQGIFGHQDNYTSIKRHENYGTLYKWKMQIIRALRDFARHYGEEKRDFKTIAKERREPIDMSQEIFEFTPLK